jgi:hypothetical protein
LQIPLRVDARLNERHQNETGREFETRLKDFLDELMQNADGDGCAYICSHLDWLELALVLITSDLSELEASSSWSTAEYRVFKLESDLWTFKLRGSIAPRGR